jgi:hypothetical protein
MCHISSAVCGANGDSITTSASIASRRTATSAGSRLFRRGALLVTARRARLLTEGVQLVDELHQRRYRRVQVHALFDVAGDARMVSCVFRRSARSASVHSSPHFGMPSPPMVSHQ